MPGGVDSIEPMVYISIMVGDELKRRRERLEMTQAELASKLKVDAQTVSRWERSARKIPDMLDRALKDVEREHKK